MDGFKFPFSMGALIVLAITLLVAAITFFSMQVSFVERIIYAFWIALPTWLLLMACKCVIDWFGDVFKKN